LLGLSLSCTAQKAIVTQQVTVSSSSQSQVDLPANPITEAQVREFLRLSGSGEVYRQSWMAALEKNRSKGEPYWPESFWSDLHDAMLHTDLAPMVLGLYQPYISGPMLQSVNDALKTKTVAELAATPLGAEFCKLQQEADAGHDAATMKMTQEILMRVYEKDKSEIKAARAKYIAAHPGYKD
jgi:hypothetical protein